MMNNIKTIILLLRIRHWIKNTFIFFPLIFAGKLFHLDLLRDVAVGFVGFSLIASGAYIINDWFDREADRYHPKKAKRPLAQGSISLTAAAVISAVLLLAGFFICYLIDGYVFSIALIYFGLQLVYNFYAKRAVIIDVIFVAVGFYIRIWFGSVAVGIIPSVWLQVCVFLIALFLGFTKRRYEMLVLEEQAVHHRHALKRYTTYFLDQMITVCAILTIIFYCLYTFSSDLVERIGSHNMVYSLVFVIYGIFRYLYLVHVEKKGNDSGEVILSDRASLVNIILWFIYILLVLYGPF